METIDRPHQKNSQSIDKLKFDSAQESLMPVIINSLPFKKRVDAALSRVSTHRAESAFSVFARDNQLFFGTLQLGGRVVQDFNDLAINLRSEVNVETMINDPNHFYHDQYLPVLVGIFHSHPDHTGFSQQDIVDYEEKLFHIKKDNISMDKITGDTQYSSKDARYGLIEGLISPTIKRNPVTKKMELVSFSLLAFSGQPSSNYYQTYDFDQTPIQKQAQVLAESGFTVIFKEFPVVNGKLDLASLSSS